MTAVKLNDPAAAARTRAPRRLPLRKKLAFSLIVLLLFLAAAEGGARLVLRAISRPQLFQADPQLGYTLRPNLDVLRQVGAGPRTRIRTDAEGTRLVPGNGEGPNADTLVLVGDSFAFGEGVEEDQSVAACLAAAGFRVVNLGVNAYGTNQELLRFRRYAAGHPGEFRWVVALVFTNDEMDVRTSYQTSRHRPTASWQGQTLALDPFELPWTDRLVDGCRLYSLYRVARRGMVVHEGDGHAIVAACLARLRDEARAAGAEPAFFVHDALNPERAEAYLAAARRQGVELGDLSPLLHERLRGGANVIGADGLHWNPAGNRLVADEILKVMAAGRADPTAAPPSPQE